MRSAMHGRHLPILATVPNDIAWYVAQVNISQLGALHTISERTWNDGVTQRCNPVHENARHIRRQLCGDRSHRSDADTLPLSLLNREGHPTHAAFVVSMVPQISTLSKIFVAVGKSFDRLTVWDGNHRALAYYMAEVENKKPLDGVAASEILGCRVVLDPSKESEGCDVYTLYVGLAESWEKGFVCH